LSDAEFRVPTQAEAAEARRYLRNPSFLVWTGDSAIGDWWFYWHNGEIELRNPPESAIAKAMKLAQRLDARVLSETGEIFNPDGTHKGFEESKSVTMLTGAASSYGSGDRVLHDKFGYGRVTFVDGDKLTVAFEKAGEKRVIGTFVRRA
jgi:hypothetical protein